MKIKALMIDETYMRQETFMGDNVHTNVLINSIRRAQQIKILPILGEKLYNKIIDDIVASTLTGNYETLLDDYIAPSLVQWALYMSVVPLNYRLTSKGLVISNDQYTEGGDIDVVNFVRNDMQNEAVFYSERLKNYLCDNSSLFPEYTELADDPDLNPSSSTGKYEPNFFGKSTKCDWCSTSGLIIM